MQSAYIHLYLIMINAVSYTHLYRINYEGTTKSNFSKKRVDYLWALEQQISFYDKIQFNQMLEELCKFYLENATEIYKKVKYELKDRALQKKIYNDTKIIYKLSLIHI